MRLAQSLDSIVKSSAFRASADNRLAGCSRNRSVSGIDQSRWKTGSFPQDRTCRRKTSAATIFGDAEFAAGLYLGPANEDGALYSGPRLRVFAKGKYAILNNDISGEGRSLTLNLGIDDHVDSSLWDLEIGASLPIAH